MNQNHLPTVFLVDDSIDVRESLTQLIEMNGLTVEAFSSAEQLLETNLDDRMGCLILDLKMPGMNGLELQTVLFQRGIALPIIFLTAHGDIPASVKAIQAGAIDFLTKPVEPVLLLGRIQQAIVRDVQRHERLIIEREYQQRLTNLTPREIEVANLLDAGHLNKSIGQQLGISHRTVENHRARIMDKTGVTNLIELANLLKKHSH